MYENMTKGVKEPHRNYIFKPDCDIKWMTDLMIKTRTKLHGRIRVFNVRAQILNSILERSKKNPCLTRTNIYYRK